MRTWNDIYDSSDKILKCILEQTEEENGRSDCSDMLNERLRNQLQYDPFQAYRKLKRRRQRRLMRWCSVAAGIVLLVGLAWGWWQGQADREAVLAETICPGHKKAVLSLADGSVWYIGDTAMTIPTAREDIRVDSNGLSLRVRNGVERSDDEVYHLLTIPRGGEFAMTLPDGSRVWLNSGSELRFPLQFAAKQRKVILMGEAYFEVKEDTTRPFVVEMNESRIEVLGTSFNVRFYRDEGRVVTTLVEGKVRFETANAQMILKPGEQSVLNEKGQLQKQMVDVYPYIAWKEGRFIFRKQRLEDIMAIVSRWYYVVIRFQDEESNEMNFYGGMMRYEGFEALVKMVETIGSVVCNIENDTVFIAKRK